MRYGTEIRDGRVCVQTPDGPLSVGRVATVLQLVGGPAWIIEYSDWHLTRYPDLDTSDEGLTVDVVDVMAAMEFDLSFVETLRALPVRPCGDDEVSPRLGLFVGRLIGNLQTGIE